MNKLLENFFTRKLAGLLAVVLVALVARSKCATAIIEFFRPVVDLTDPGDVTTAIAAILATVIVAWKFVTGFRNANKNADAKQTIAALAEELQKNGTLDKFIATAEPVVNAAIDRALNRDKAGPTQPGKIISCLLLAFLLPLSACLFISCETTSAVSGVSAIAPAMTSAQKVCDSAEKGCDVATTWIGYLKTGFKFLGDFFGRVSAAVPAANTTAAPASP
jgi:hypothetical protein